MRSFLLAIAGFALALSPLAAQEVDTNTRAGLAQILQAPDGTRVVVIGNTMLNLPPDAYIADFQARVGDLLLVGYSAGGNACPRLYTWVHATPGDIRRSEEFGTCAELTGVTWDAQTLRVSMPSAEPGQGPVTFIYDGKNPIWVEQAALANSGMAAGDWGFWIGRYPFDFLAAGELQLPLRALMGEAALLRAQTLMELANPMEQDGEWVVGRGCKKFSCDQDRVAVAVNIRDGRMLVAMAQADRAPQIWGYAGGFLPLALREIMGQ